MVTKARKQHERKTRLLTEREKLMKALNQNSQELNQSSSTRLMPIIDPTGGQHIESRATSFEEFELIEKEGCAVRMCSKHSKHAKPVMQASRLFENEEWHKNMSELIELKGTSVAPRIFNPDDDENNPTKDVLDCVAILAKGRPCCTGTLIAPNAVLTAAHCVKTAGKPSCGATHVYVGWNANNATPDRLYRIQQEIAHPDYDSTQFFNDVAILILKDPIPSDVAEPRGLAYPDEIKGSKSFLAMGFGLTDQGQIGVKFEAPVALAKLYNFEIEAGGAGFDSCQGDSGGPLFYVGKKWQDKRPFVPRGRDFSRWFLWARWHLHEN